MVDIVYTLTATFRRDTVATLGKGDAGNLKFVTATRSVTARADGDTMKMMRLPSAARISGLSNVDWDDLDSAGAPTMDVGVASVGNNITTNDPNGLSDAHDITSAGSENLIDNHADYGKALWEFVSGLTEDPGGELDIYVSFVDATTNITGDVTVEVAYTLD